MTTAQQMLWGLVPAAYLVGSVPFGLIVGLSRGVDPRIAGSGNIGATNVGRLLGMKFFALVFILDLLKGLLPMLMAGWIVRRTLASATPSATVNPRGLYSLWLLVGFSAIFGHMFSAFLKFKGGKGVATSSGVMLGVYPYFTPAAVVALGVWYVIFKMTRYVSVASMIAAVVFVFAYLLTGLWRHWPVFGEQLPLLGFAVLIAALIIYKHRPNLARLRAGTENRFGVHQ